MFLTLTTTATNSTAATSQPLYRSTSLRAPPGAPRPPV